MTAYHASGSGATERSKPEPFAQPHAGTRLGEAPFWYSHTMSIIRSASKLGLLLSAVFMVGGAALIAYPTEMIVHHPVSQKGAIFRERTGVEVADHTRGRIYGGAQLLIGVVVGAFSLYKPRT